MVPGIVNAVVAAMQAAGATEEMIAAAVGAYGAWERAPRRQGGRPRKYQNRAECDRAYRERRKLREKTCEKTSPEEKTGEETSEKTPAPALTKNDTIPESRTDETSGYASFRAQIGTGDLRPHRPHRSYRLFSTGWRGRLSHCHLLRRPQDRPPSALMVLGSCWPHWISIRVRTMRTVRTVAPPHLLARDFPTRR